MPSKGLSVVPNGIARLLGSTVKCLEKEFRYFSPSSQRPAPAAPVRKPSLIQTLMAATPAPKAVAVKPPESSLATAEPEAIRRVEPVTAAPAVEAVVASPAVPVKSPGALVRDIPFESKAEQIRAEIYFRDLRSSNKSQRMEALREIRNLSRPTLIAGLEQALGQEPEALQIIEILNALAAVGIVGVGVPVPKRLFIDYAGHPDSGVRLAALRAISKYGDEESFGILNLYAKDKDPEVRRQILNCLCWSYSERCLPSAFKALHDPDPGVRKAGCHIVGTLKAELAISALISLLSDTVADVQESASSALKKISKQDFDFRVSGSKKDKDQAIEGWRYWWRENQTNVRRGKKP